VPRVSDGSVHWPTATVSLQDVLSRLLVTVTRPLGVPEAALTAKLTVIGVPASVVPAGLVPVMLVVVGIACTVTVVVRSAVPSTVAVIVLVSTADELNVNAADPSAPVTADVGVNVLSLPVELRTTVRPLSGRPPASRTTTVMVLGLPACTVEGEAVIVDWLASGGAAATVMLDDVTGV
jgi:hypothetical protein